MTERKEQIISCILAFAIIAGIGAFSMQAQEASAATISTAYQQASFKGSTAESIQSAEEYSVAQNMQSAEASARQIASHHSIHTDSQHDTHTTNEHAFATTSSSFFSNMYESFSSVGIVAIALMGLLLVGSIFSAKRLMRRNEIDANADRARK